MDNTLETIVTEINNNSVEIENCSLLARDNGRKALQLAIRTGELLCQCKEELRKANVIKTSLGGETTGWKEWIDQNVKGFGERMGQYYIKLHKTNTKRVSFFDDCESIREALKKIQQSEQQETFIETTDDETETPTQPRPRQTTPSQDPDKSGWEKTVKRKVGSLVRMFKKYRLGERSETVSLLAPLVQIWNERPVQTVTFDNGRMITETEPKEEMETVTVA